MNEIAAILANYDEEGRRQKTLKIRIKQRRPNQPRVLINPVKYLRLPDYMAPWAETAILNHRKRQVWLKEEIKQAIKRRAGYNRSGHKALSRQEGRNIKHFIEEIENLDTLIEKLEGELEQIEEGKADPGVKLAAAGPIARASATQAIFEVQCPKCKSMPGVKCTTFKGMQMTYTHSQRIREYRNNIGQAEFDRRHSFKAHTLPKNIGMKQYSSPIFRGTQTGRMSGNMQTIPKASSAQAKLTTTRKAPEIERELLDTNFSIERLQKSKPPRRASAKRKATYMDDLSKLRRVKYALIRELPSGHS
jgi:phage FluMu protein Com